MKDQVESIIKRLREVSNDIGKLPRGIASETEVNLDTATDFIHKAVVELEEIIDREG